MEKWIMLQQWFEVFESFYLLWIHAYFSCHPLQRCKLNPEIIPDACPLDYASTKPVEQIGFTLVYVLTSTRLAALHICSSLLQQSEALWNKYTGHDAANQLNLATSRQEVMHWNNNMTSGYFSKWNTLCWRQHTNLKKEPNTSSSTNPSVRNTLCWCFYNPCL